MCTAMGQKVHLHVFLKFSHKEQLLRNEFHFSDIYQSVNYIVSHAK